MSRLLSEGQRRFSKARSTRLLAHCRRIQACLILDLQPRPHQDMTPSRLSRPYFERSIESHTSIILPGPPHHGTAITHTPRLQSCQTREDEPHIRQFHNVENVEYPNRLRQPHSSVLLLASVTPHDFWQMTQGMSSVMSCTSQEERNHSCDSNENALPLQLAADRGPLHLVVQQQLQQTPTASDVQRGLHSMFAYLTPWTPHRRGRLPCWLPSPFRFCATACCPCVAEFARLHVAVTNRTRSSTRSVGQGLRRVGRLQV